MQVHVKFFALFREYIGLKEDWPEIEPGTTVGQLWQRYLATSRNPRAAAIRAAFSVNQKLANAETVLQGGEEIGFLPPVSGGAGKPVRRTRAKQEPRKKSDAPARARVQPRVSITSHKLNLAELIARVEHAGAGAIVTFTGVVRDSAHGKTVQYLEYEAYPEMAKKVMEEIVQEAETRWTGVRVAMAHRTGPLRVGGASLVIAVSGPHRPEAFAACRYALERVKAVLPVWKKEFALDGDYWVEGPVAGEHPSEEAVKIAMGIK